MSDVLSTESVVELVFAPEAADVVVQAASETTVVATSDTDVVVTVDLLPVEVTTPEEVAHVIETGGEQGPPGPGTNEEFSLDLNAIYQIAKL